MNKNKPGHDAQKPHAHFLESRLCCYEKERSMFYGCIGKYYSLTKHVDEDEANCWVELSALVCAGRALGFPLVYGVRSHARCGRTLYFELFRDMRVRRFTSDARCVPLSTLFQIAAALYTLYRRGIFADCFVFDLVTIPRTTLSVAVNQVVFTLSTDTLVVLSLTTRLYRAQLPQSCYLAYFANKPELARKNLVPSEYFFEWLIRNHFDMLARPFLDVFKLKKKYVTTPHVHRLTEPGTLVYVTREDAQLLGVTLTEVSINDNVRVLFSPDGGNVFEVDDFALADVFASGELLTRAQTVPITL
ncbi:internal virion protein [Equine molluscum contagiosum-like virus]|nr:internal virion protein [Equine molluscum contagiosum-like virus]